MIQHPIPPLYNSSSEILILGSFPSVKSREAMFFYGHPQNRFWKVIAGVFGDSVPQTIEEKKHLILDHHLALWDVISSCEIEGSSDASIKNVTANDLSPLLQAASIDKILVNGKTAEKLYIQYIQPKTQFPAICLPSTSPANAAWNLERLIDAWGKVLKS